MRHPIRAIDGLLLDSNLHPVQPDRRHLMGVLLAEPERVTSPRVPGCHHRAHHDHAHVLDQRGAAQDLLRQVDRYLSGNLLRYGLRLSSR